MKEKKEEVIILKERINNLAMTDNSFSQNNDKAISCDENPLNKTNVTSVLEGVSRKILN